MVHSNLLSLWTNNRDYLAELYSNHLNKACHVEVKMGYSRQTVRLVYPVLLIQAQVSPGRCHTPRAINKLEFSSA